jgi:carboxyl-terminal processing protease
MPHRTRRALLSVTLFLGVCAVLGSVISQKVSAQSASDESNLRDSLHAFTDVYSIVEQNYAEHLDQDKTDKAIYDGAIPGMLHTLDPHSNFYDPKAFAQMREDQHGRYYGVGMTIQPQPMPDGKTRVVVLYPFEGTPSFKAGIRPGDVILTIDGKSAEGMDSAAVASLLKGPKGTHVSVTMEREGAPKPLVFDLVRDDIPHPSVDLAFLIRPDIGYIHVANFSSETTSREVGDALDKFQASGELKGLLIDLRSNPGGLLNEAVNMSDKFLQKGQIIVSQRGRAFPDQVYRATRGEQGNDKYPIVVLVNRNTASAAEIVSGALQDHDRALIVGETTFGKGLVQTVFQITENTGLALTTYHYYTPSGRLIQRNYDHVSLYDYYYVRDDAAKADKSNLEVKLTDSGRTVYGGGGITPDEKIEPIKYSRFQESLPQHYAFFNFSKHYLASHTVSKDFVVDDAVMQQFKDFLKANQIDYTDADIAGASDWI